MTREPQPFPPLVTPRRAVLRSAVAGAAGLAWPLGLSGAAGAQTAPKRGGTLKVAVPTPKTLDPVIMENSGAIAIVQQVAEYLVWVETDLSLRPVLATAWRTADGGRTWVFDIREGVTFHDGRPLTADDVVASFQRLVDPASKSAGAAQVPFLKKDGISKLASHQVQFVLDRPIGQFPYYTHIYNAVILPADYAGGFDGKPIGTGPFRMTSYKPQQGASFVRNETYWDEGKPYIDRLEIGAYESPQAMSLAVQGGEADVLLGSSYIDALPFLQNPNITVLTTPAAEHRQVCMRCDQPPFDDKRVRQAVALALRRPELVRGLLGGKADLGNDHVVAPLYPTALALQQRQADLAAAKALLADAGKSAGFEVDLHTANYLELPQYAQLLKQMLEPIGIRLNLKIEPLTVYYDHWTEVSFGITDWTSRPTPEQILGTAFKSTAEWNAAKWKNAAFDRAVEALEAEPDPTKRSALASEAAAIMHDEVPAVIAYFNNNLRPVRNHVRGVEGNISQFLDLTQASLA